LAFLSDFCEAENERFDSDEEEKIRSERKREAVGYMRDIFIRFYVI